MGILDKIMFWKKKDDLGDTSSLGDLGGLGKDNLAFGDNFNPSAGQLGQQGFGQAGQDFGQGLGQGQGFSGGTGNNYGPRQSYGQYPSQPMASFGSSSYPQQGYSQQDEITSKNIEIVSSKLDALRATLESINQRLENIEAIARGDEDTSRRRRYY